MRLDFDLRRDGDFWGDLDFREGDSERFSLSLPIDSTAAVKSGGGSHPGGTFYLSLEPK